MTLAEIGEECGATLRVADHDAERCATLSFLRACHPDLAAPGGAAGLRVGEKYLKILSNRT